MQAYLCSQHSVCDTDDLLLIIRIHACNHIQHRGRSAAFSGNSFTASGQKEAGWHVKQQRSFGILKG